MPKESGSRSFNAGWAECGRGTSRLKNGSVDKSQQRQAKNFVRSGEEIHQIFATIVLRNLEPSSLAERLSMTHNVGNMFTHMSILRRLLQNLHAVGKYLGARLPDMLGLGNGFWTVQQFVDVPLAACGLSPEGEVGPHGFCVRIGRVWSSSRDVPVRNHGRSPETKGQALVDEVVCPKQEVRELGILSPIRTGHSMVAQSLTQLRGLGRERPGEIWL